MQALRREMIQSVQQADRALILDVYGSREGDGGAPGVAAIASQAFVSDLLFLDAGAASAGADARRDPDSLSGSDRPSTSTPTSTSTSTSAGVRTTWSATPPVAEGQEPGAAVAPRRLKAARYVGSVDESVSDISRQLVRCGQMAWKEDAQLTIRVVCMGAGDIDRVSRGVLESVSQEKFEPLVPVHSQKGTNITF